MRKPKFFAQLRKILRVTGTPALCLKITRGCDNYLFAARIRRGTMFMVLKMIFNSLRTTDSLSLDFVSLSDLNQGDTAMLGEFDLSPLVADHLMNLGFIPGTEVTVAQSGPGGDPRIYRVDRTEVALRRNLSDRITVQLLPAKKPALSVALDEVALVLQAGDASAD